MTMEKTLLIFSCLALFSSGNEVENVEASMTIYYETLCPDSLRFIALQVSKAYSQFTRDLHVTFKPFGIASFSDEAGSWVFDCQHGPQECYGNMMHACLTNMVSEEEGLTPLIICVITYGSTDILAVDTCLSSSTTSDVTSLQVEECMMNEGATLLHDIGVETKDLDPPLYGVPWTLFNGEFNEEDFLNSDSDLIGVLCSKYLVGHPQC